MLLRLLLIGHLQTDKLVIPFQMVMVVMYRIGLSRV